MDTRLLTSLLLILATATSAHADLTIERLYVRAMVSHNIGFGAIDNESASDPMTPLGQPMFAAATVANADLQSFAFQTKSGFFSNRADLLRGSGSLGSLLALSTTEFVLIVGADAPNTPLVLDFDFLGAELVGSVYFRMGGLDVSVSQKIQAGRVPDVSTINPTEVWGFQADVALGFNDSIWTTSFTSTDVQSIGLPTHTVTSFEDTINFSGGRRMELDSFHGQLDFGLLQPGEYFSLTYEASAEAQSNHTYDLGPGSYATAVLVDPFSLGGPPPPQLALSGLLLPVPEPTSALFVMAGTALLAGRRARKQQAGS